MPAPPKATPWVYFRSFLQWMILAPVMLFYFLLVFLCVALAPKFLEPILRSFARAACRVAGLKIRVHGTLPQPGHAYVVVFNHTNIFDLFSMYVFYPLKARGLEKESHFKWPLYGRFLQRLGQIPIPPKGNTKGAISSLEKAKTIFRQGTTICIAPEGTRSADGTLGPFKKGAFHMAIQLQADILPIVLKGMYEFNQKGSLLLFPRTIDVYFEPVIPTQGMTAKDVSALRDQLRAKILSRLEAA